MCGAWRPCVEPDTWSGSRRAFGRFRAISPSGEGFSTLRRSGGVNVTLHSHLSIDRQSKAIGATWLDQQLLKPGIEVPATPFGAALKVAFAERRSVSRG